MTPSCIVFWCSKGLHSHKAAKLVLDFWFLEHLLLRTIPHSVAISYRISISFPESLFPLGRGRKTRAQGATTWGMHHRCTRSSNKNNVADQTSKRTWTLHAYRCCNCSFQNNLIDLFGAKSESGQLIALLGNMTGLDFLQNDGFSRQLCKICYNQVKQFVEFCWSGQFNHV